MKVLASQLHREELNHMMENNQNKILKEMKN